MQKHTDVNENIYCTYFEGEKGDPLNKDYFSPKSKLYGPKAF